MAFQIPPKQPDFSKFEHLLLESKINTENPPLYQFLKNFLHSTSQMQGLFATDIATASGSGVIGKNGVMGPPGMDGEEEMPRIPKRIVGPIQIATGPTTVYTVPAVTKTILKWIHVSNPSAAPVTLTLTIGADGVTTRLWSTYSIPAGAVGVTDSVRDIPIYMIMEAGEILTLSAGTNNILVIAISADECILG